MLPRNEPVDKDARLTDRAVGSQCLNCGHTRTPDQERIRCARCGSLDLHLFPVEAHDNGQNN
jgi:uncharacterized OB-fold protein